MTADRVPGFCRPDGIYLLSHSVGLLPVATRDWGLANLFEAWEHDPANAWPRWLVEVERFRTSLARLFNHDARWFCPQANVSAGLTKVLHALPVRPDKPVILLSEEAFPSLGFVCERARAAGYGLRFIDRSRNCRDPQVWADHLAARSDGGAVGIVLITQVHSNTGELIPVESIVDVARAAEAKSIVDVAQSAGVIPLDLRALTPDFLVGSAVKWLCGGAGAGFLWVNPVVIDDCNPVDVGWFSHQQPFEFDIHRFRPADDALRFWGGSPSVAAPAIAARSIEVMADIGSERLRAHNLTLTEGLLGALDPALIVSPRTASQRSGTVIIHAGEQQRGLLERLLGHGITVDERSTGLRVSPHIYNTMDEVLAFSDTLTEAVA